MSATTHRVTGLFAFAVLCILPTTGTAYLAFYLNRPQYASEVATQLSGRLGWDAELATVAFPRPGVTEYRGLLLRHRGGTDAAIGFDRLRIQRDGRRWKLDAEDASVNLVGAGTVGPAPQRSRDHRSLLQEVFGRFVPRDGDDFVMTVSDLSIRTERRSQVIGRATFRYYVDRSNRPRLAATFRLARTRRSLPASLELVLRSRSDLGFETVRLHTGATGLPASIAMPFADLESLLGSDCRLRGRLTGRNTTQGWQWSFQGNARRVDLERLAGEALSHQLSGLSEWSIDRFLWYRGRVQQMRGRVTGGPGSVSAELLNVLTQEAGFASGRGVPTRGTVAYDRLAFDFRIYRGALELSGTDATWPANLIMTGPQGRSLLSSPLGAGSLLSFARALSRQPGGPVVQVAYEPDRLMKILPIDAGANREHVEVRRAAGSLAESIPSN